ncbi:hypothetical protein DFH08DRAFT_827380 [Mycena albidolilacea]|uniref:DUF7779 domain-containing protein n=1 Tax=Mycena albidolilacea TaxID=1033008 RepID=A0AAD6YYV4_9AGAR|nr:hypothetical protein DFH08DRAFT_827380 [Mycena albidolilacea]
MDASGSDKALKSMSSPKKWGLQIQTVQRTPARRNSDWLGTSLLAARTISAAAESFPYVKTVFGTVVILLETVETVKKNREELKELCGNVMEIITIVRDQISLHEDTAAVKFKSLSQDLEECLHGVLNAVRELERKPEGLHGRIKEIIGSRKTADEIAGYEKKIRELRSNLTATMDTNFQVHKVLTVLSPAELVPPVKRSVNNCPLPSRIFHGRKNILEKLNDYFLSGPGLGKQYIFLLYGLGGAGKTQIGLKFIQNSFSHFFGIFLIDSSTTQTIETSLKNIAETNHVGSTPRDALMWLSGEPNRWLLFFDNADDPHLNLNKYFPQCNHGNILITSRNPGLSVYTTFHCLVSDMDEIEAVELLLKSAAQNITPKNAQISTEIVKVLWYFPLAIIQAGAFIAKYGVLHSYLELYNRNRARLLSEKPTQCHDEYAWTVYTTWQMSFDRLSPRAAVMLQFCSFLHHRGISEEIFCNASEYKSTPGSPSQEELQDALNFLSQFLGPTGDWESLNFMNVTNRLRAYSLVNFDPETNMFSIHPLVHSWLRSTISDVATDHPCMVAIIGMCIATMDWTKTAKATQWLVPHIESLLQGRMDVTPDFNMEYGKIYRWSGYLKKAEEFGVVALDKLKKILGEDHPATLKSGGALANTYLYLGQYNKAEDLATFVFEKQRLALGMDHPETLGTIHILSMILIELGKFKDAEKLEVIALEKRRQVLGIDDPATLLGMTNLGWILHNLGRLKEEEEFQAIAVEKQKTILGQEHPHTLWTMTNLGSTYRNLGQLSQAEELESFALQKLRKTLGEDHPYTVWTMARLALTYSHLEKAQEIQVTVLEKMKLALGDEHPDTIRAMKELDAICIKLVQLSQIQNSQVSTKTHRLLEFAWVGSTRATVQPI